MDLSQKDLLKVLNRDESCGGRGDRRSSKVKIYKFKVFRKRIYMVPLFYSKKKRKRKEKVKISYTGVGEKAK